MTANDKDVKIDVDDDAIEISAEKEASRRFMQKCGKGRLCLELP